VSKIVFSGTMNPQPKKAYLIPCGKEFESGKPRPLEKMLAVPSLSVKQFWKNLKETNGYSGKLPLENLLKMAQLQNTDHSYTINRVLAEQQAFLSTVHQSSGKRKDIVLLLQQQCDMHPSVYRYLKRLITCEFILVQCTPATKKDQKSKWFLLRKEENNKSVRYAINEFNSVQEITFFLEYAHGLQASLRNTGFLS